MSDKKEQKANKISKESAQIQINEWLDYYGLDFADIVIEDGEAAAQTLMNTLIRAIQRGELEISTEGDLKVIQNLKKPTEKIQVIVYLDKVSNARIAMDKVPAKQIQSRMYEFMSALCSVPTVELLKLKGPDATIFNRVATVFSMV